MTRGIAALFVLLAITSAWAQTPSPDNDRWDRADRASQREIERAERREQRRIRREEQRERMERFRDRIRDTGLHLRVFQDYFLAEGATATDQVLVVGGTATINGHLEDDAVVVGGTLRLGPTAVVDGDVVTLGGSLIRDPGAKIGGSIDQTAMPWPRIVFAPGWNLDGWWSGIALWGSVIRLSFVLVLSVLLTLVAPGWIAGIADRPAASSGVFGLVTEILFVPALVILVVMLVVSIVGIPLLAGIPFLLAGFAFLWLAGFAGFAVRLGRTIRGSGPAQASVGDLLLGYSIIVAVTVAGHLLAMSLGWVSGMIWPVRSAGLAIEYVAWTIGLGAALTNLFMPSRLGPPPIPVQSGL